MQAAQAKISQAETNLKLAEKNEVRFRQLLQENAISAQTYDIYKTQLESAKADFSSAQASLENAKISFLKNDENLAQQKILAEQIKNLQSQLESVELNIKETELQNFEIGDEIFLVGRDENLKISGKIESIRRKADFATQKATSERGETDIISFNLKVRTDNEKIFPGMRFKMENE